MSAANVTRKTGRNRIVVPGAEQALENFKYEVANELGINYNGDLGELSSRQNGYVGGYKVRKMVEQYEGQLTGKPKQPQS